MDLQKEKQIKQQMEAEKAKAAQVAPKVEERPVKLREILSDYYYKRRNNLDPVLLRDLRETARREPVTADSYGTYKPGTFTFGSFVVDVEIENGLWKLEIYPGEKNGTIPENVVEQIRYKFIPDDVWMVKTYAPREEQRKLQGVLLMQLPSGEAEEE